MNRRHFLQAGLGTTAVLLNPPSFAHTQEKPPTPVEVLEALWKAIREHYPMLEYVGSHGDAWLEEFRPRVAAAPDLPGAFPILEELVSRLRDYHTSLTWPGKPDRASLPIRGHEVPVPPSSVVVRQSGTELVKVGEEILGVGGRPVGQGLAETRRLAVGSSPEARSRSAVDRLLSAPRGTEVVVQVRRNTGETPREVRLRAEGYPEAEPTVAHRSLDANTGILRIPRWYGRPGEDLAAVFDAALEPYRNMSQLVIDVRSNGGGLDNLADAVTGRFLERRAIASISFHRIVPTLNFERTVEWCEPRGPWRYSGRVAVLIDEGCASACEHFVSGMLAAGACLFGMPTTGACGWIRRIELPGGAVLFCARTFPLHGLLPSPLLGIEPHFRVPVSVADLRSSRDGALDKARQWLRSGDPRPARRQPV